MPDESFAVRRKIGFERGYDRREYAADALTHGSSLVEHLESSIQYRESSIRHRQKNAADGSNVFVAVNARGYRIASVVARDCVPSYMSPCVVVSEHRCVHPNPNCAITFTSFYSPKLR